MRLQLVKAFGTVPGEEWAWFVWPSVEVSSGRLWSAESHNYRLTEWNADAQRLRVLQRRPSWFPWPVETPGKIVQPNPHIGAISVDEEGLIWVFILVAAPKAKEGFARVPANSVEVEVNRIDWGKGYPST